MASGSNWLSGVNVVLVMAYGSLVFVLLFIFVKRQIMRFAMKSRRGPHVPVGHNAPKVGLRGPRWACFSCPGRARSRRLSPFADRTRRGIIGGFIEWMSLELYSCVSPHSVLELPSLFSRVKARSGSSQRQHQSAAKDLTQSPEVSPTTIQVTYLPSSQKSKRAKHFLELKSFKDNYNTLESTL
nr:protein C1orf43 homolog [Mirounga angustirostris]